MRRFLIPALAVAILPLTTSCLQKEEELPQLEKLENIVITPPPETVSVRIRDFCPLPGESFRELYASNFSVKVVNANVQRDSDRDGVPDFLEVSHNAGLNISPDVTDSNGDGYSDLLMYLSGIDRYQQDRLRCRDDERGDSDGDGVLYISGGAPQFVGLSDCEERRLTLTDADNFDSDGDDVPDYLELRCGLNPRDAGDAQLDTDSDGVSNIEECKRNTPINESNNEQSVGQLEYKYTAELDSRLGQGCMQLRIQNIPVLDGGTDNLLAFYLLTVDGSQVRHLHVAFLMLPQKAAGNEFDFDAGGFVRR